MSEGGVWSAIYGDYARRLRFSVAATLSFMVLLLGAPALLGVEPWARPYCAFAGAMVLMIWTGLVSGHLKLVLARHQARLLPGYAGAQVLAGASLVAPVAVLSAVLHWTAGSSVLAAVALASVAASVYWAVPYLCTQGNLLLFLGPPAVVLAGQPRVHGWWERVNPGWSEQGWSVVAIAFAAGLAGIVVSRMLRLNESSPEYDRDPSLEWRSGRPIDQEIPFSGFFNRLLPGFGRYRLLGLSSAFEAGFPARVQLWRKGMSRTSPMVTGLSQAGMVALIGVIFAIHPAGGPRSQIGVLGLYLMFFAVIRGAYLHRRRERLPYEALYPVARERMLKELGGATAVDLAVTWVFLWVGTLLVRSLGLFPDVTWTALLSYAGFSLGTTALGSGLIPWLVRVPGSSAFLLVLYLGTLAVGVPVAIALARGPGIEAVTPWAAAGAALAGLGAALGYAGYRNWCELELGRTDLGTR